MTAATDSILQLLHLCTHGSLATQSLSMPGYPYLSVLPFVVDEHHAPVFLISGLAEHTRNLEADARAALLVVEPAVTDVQGGARLTILGEIQSMDRHPTMIQRMLRYQPSAAQLLELADFRLVRMRPDRLRIIAGLGRMGWMDGQTLLALPALDPDYEAQLLADLTARVAAGIRLLGIDRWGVDLSWGTSRHRLAFASPPLSDPALGRAVLQAVASLSTQSGPHPGP